VGAGSTRLGQSRDSFSINAATGNLVLQGFDEGLVARGLGAAAVRTYNSRGQVSDAGQDGWVTGYERRVVLNGTLGAAGSSVTVQRGDGSVQTFWNIAGTTSYASAEGEGAHDSLSWDTAGSVWRLVEGSSRREEVYANHADAVQLGRLLSIRDLRSDGATPAQFNIMYDTQGRVSEVRAVDGATTGDAIVYGYVGKTQQLASISTRENGVPKTQVSYGYDVYGRLTWVQTDLTPDKATDNTWDAVNAASNDGRLFRTTYEYLKDSASDLRIARVTGSDGATVAYTYEKDGLGGYRILTVTEGSGSDASARTLTFDYGANVTDVIDNAGRTWTYQYDAQKRLTAVLEPAVNGMRTRTAYEYDIAGNVTRITGNAMTDATAGAALVDVVFRYDNAGNRILQRDLLGNTIVWSYSASNQVLTETRYTVADADGLDPTHVGTVNLPSGALTTQYVYDAQDRVRFVVNAAGEVRELNYAGSGNGIGELASERRYLGAVYSGAYTEAALQSWASDAATMRRAASALTTYVYDAKGRLQQTIEYATVSGDAAGNGVSDAGASITRYTHDAQGQLLQKIVSRGAARTDSSALAGSEVTEYVYDGMGRLLSVLSRDAGSAPGNDALTVQSTYAYVDSKKQIRVTLDTGLIRTEARNSAGDILSISEAGSVGGSNVTRTAQNVYDNTGRLRGSQDAAGGRSYFFYDDGGRLVATVDPTGAVVRTIYDELGRKVETIGMENRVDTSTWLMNGTVVKSELVFDGDPATLAAHQAWVDYGNDRSTSYAYDAAGRLATMTDAVGLVTTHTYDGASRLMSTMRTVPSLGWAGVTIKRLTAPEQRTTRFFYDSADRLVGTLDAEGYLNEVVYDAGGRAVKMIRYATLTNSTYWASGTLAQLRPVNAGDDQATRYFYDARGRQTGTLDAEGYLTESLYDEASNQRAVKEYAKRLTGLTGSETLSALRTAATTAAPVEAFRLTQNSYNGLGQLVTSLNHEGTVTRYIYDEAGRLVKTEAAQGATEVREGNRRYDVFGNLIGELSGENAVQLLAGMTEAQLDAVYASYGVRHSYDLLGRRIESTDALGNKTWMFYDANGRQTLTVRGVEDSANIRNAQGEVSEVRYNAFGEATDTIAYTGRITIAVPGNRSSAQSAISTLQYIAAQDSRTEFGYDAMGHLVSQIDAEAHTTLYNYNSFGDLGSIGRYSNNGPSSSTAYLYDRRGLRTRQTDSASGLTRSVNNTYDAFGRVTRQVDARGTIRDLAYDRLGRQISTTTRGVSGQDLVQTSSYDVFDRVLTQTDATGRITSYAYSDSARSVTVTSAEGVSITTLQNRFGQTVEVRQPQPGGTTAVTTSVYDRNGNLTQRTDPLGNSASNAYDVRGLLTTSTDATGRQIAYSYDAVGRTLTRVEDPGAGKLNLTTRYAFDGQGRTVQVTDASGRVSAMTYDRKGQLIELALDPNGLNLRTTYTWDRDGRQLSVFEGAGTAAARQTAYVYDGFGRRISETVGTGSAQIVTNYQYDANDNVVRKTGAGGTVQFAYDAANRLRFTVDATGGLTEQVYDRAGRVSAQRSYAKAVNLSSLGTAVPTEAQLAGFVTSQTLRDDAQDLTVYQVYDGDGRVRLSIDGTGGVVENVYDSAGRRIAEKRYVRALSLTTALRDQIAAGTVTIASLLASTPASVNDIVVNYVYDANGNVVRKTGAGGTAQFAYDAANRLRFSVDAIGGLTETAYDRAGRVTAQRSYAKAVNLSSLGTAVPTEAQLAGFVTTQTLRNDAQDQAVYQVYDSSGRVRLSIDGIGGVVDSVYDSAGRRIAEKRYASSLTLSAALRDTLAAGTGVIALLLAATPQNAQTDSVMRYFYDASDRVVYTVDSNGGMTRMWYDTAGRVVSTRQFAKPAAVATLATATVASLDAQIDLAAGYEGESRVYDGAGRLRFVIAADGVLRETRYDAAGRVVSTLRYFASATALQTVLNTSLSAGTAQVADFAAFVAANEATAASSHSVYDAAGRQRLSITRTSATQASVVVQQYDQAGRVVGAYAYTALLSVDAALSIALSQGSVTEASLSTWLGANRATAQIQRMAYDAAGRVAYSIDGVGAVTSTRYNALGMVASVRQHAQAVTLGLLGTTLDAAMVASALVETAQDRVDYNVYDAAARVVFRVHADGSTQEIRYDAMGRRVTMLAYAGSIGSLTGAPSALMTQVVGGSATPADFAGFVAANSANARIETTFYDAAGRVRYRMARSAAGSAQISESVYDAMGRLLAQTRYGVEIPIAGIATTQDVASAINAALSQNAALRATQMSTTRYFYDANGQQRFVLDAVGALVEQRFDGIGRVIETLAYGQRPTAAAVDAASLSVWAQTLPVGASRKVSMAYDLAGQVTTRTDALGQAERFVYDAAGNITRHTNRNGAIWTYEYDLAGRRTAEISPQAMVYDTASTGSVRSIVTRFEYDGVNNVTAKIEDATGATSRVTRYAYDNRGHQIRITLPDAQTGASAAIGINDTIEVVYNTLGQAVVEKDALGNFSYKVYDRLGRVAYDIDQALQITSHAYSAFGDETRTVRYANTLNVQTTIFMAGNWQPGRALTSDLVASGLTTSPQDREIESTYTLLGQKEYVIQLGTVAGGRPTLKSTYNAYGEVVKNSVLLSGTSGQADAVWAETYHYFDGMGREIASVDAEGYVNSQTYNVYGEIIQKTEHARSLWLVRTQPLVLDTAIPPALPADGNAQMGFDRTQSFEYDALGRVTRQTTRRHVQISSASAPQVVDLAATFGYDNEGNLTRTDTAQGTTLTVFDALGHATSVQALARNVAVANADAILSANVNTNLTTASLYELRSPYSEIRYDAFGNMVQTKIFANGKVGTSAAVANANADQSSELRYDRRGRVVEESDSSGRLSMRAYDAADRTVMVTTLLRGGDPLSVQGGVESTITSNIVYDKTGRQISSVMTRRRLENTGTQIAVSDYTDASEIVRYNAFGEVIAKDDRIDNAFTNGDFSSYEYDGAGRIVRSNAEGGAWRDYVYDLGGRMVRTLQKSFTVVRNGSGQDVQQVVDAITINSLDRLGRVVRQELPSNSDNLNQKPVIEREYDRWGNATLVRDAKGYVTTYEYNDQNKIAKETRPQVLVVNNNGTQTRTAPVFYSYYDALGQLTETRDANGNSRRYVYDNAGRVIRSVDALGNATLHAYDLGDREVYTQSPRASLFGTAYISYTEYDRAGRAVSQGDFENSGPVRNKLMRETYGLGVNDERWTSTNAVAKTMRYEYEGRKLLLGSRSAAGVIKRYVYDLQGRKIRETNGGEIDQHRDLLTSPLYRDVTFNITALWNTPYAAGSHDLITSLGYVLANTAMSASWSRGQVYLDRDGELGFADEQTWDYDYFGRVIDHNDLGGKDYNYTYHALTGQLVRTTVSGAPAAVAIVRPDLMTQAISGTGMTATSAVSASLSDPSGVVATLAADERLQFYYASGLLKEIREGGNWTRYAYDASGNRTMEETYTKDGLGRIVWLRTMISYDAQNRISAVQQQDMQLNDEIMITHYSYDAVGNRRRVTTGESSDWGFTPLIEAHAGVPMQPVSLAEFIGHLGLGSEALSVRLAGGQPLPEWLKFDLQTQTLYGTPPSVQTLTLKLEATYLVPDLTDADGNPAYVTVPQRDITLQVTDAVKLEWFAGATVEAYVGQSMEPRSVQYYFSQKIPDLTAGDGNYLATATLGDGSALPSWLHFDANTMTFTGSPPNAQAFTVRVNVRSVEDGRQYSRDIAFNVLQSRPPTLNYSSTLSWDQTIDVGWGQWVFDAADAFVEPDGQPLTYTAAGDSLPVGMQLNPNTGRLTLAPTAPGDYTILITATDPDGQSIERVLHLVVNPWQVVVDVVSSPSSVQIVDVLLFAPPSPDSLSSGAFPSLNGATLTNVTIASTTTSPLPSWIRLRHPATGEWKLELTTSMTFIGQRQVKIKATYSNGQIIEKTVLIVVRNPDIIAPATNVELASGNTTAKTSAGGLAPQPPGPGPKPNGAYVQKSERWRSFWFDYDAESHVTIANAAMRNGEIVLGAVAQGETDISYKLIYDEAGNQTVRFVMKSGALMYQTTDYNDRGQRIMLYTEVANGSANQKAEGFSYDQAGRLGTHIVKYIGGVNIYANDALRKDVYTYDADGRQETMVSHVALVERYVANPPGPTGITYNLTYVPQAQAQLGDQIVYRAFARTSYGYDNAREGRISGVSYEQWYNDDGTRMPDDRSIWNTYSYHYSGGEGYLESAIVAGSSQEYAQTTVTRSGYDDWGRRMWVSGGGNERRFAYNMASEILQKTEGKTTRYAMVNGKQIASSREGWIDAVSGLTGYSSDDSNSSTVTVIAGDTLRSISQRVYGTDSLWYVIADANAINESNALVAGTTLNVPAVKVSSNDVNTFKPYNPNEVVGNTTPTVHIEPPSAPGCTFTKVLLTIIVIVIVVLVTYFTAGALTTPAATGGAAVVGTTAAVTTTAAATTLTWSAVAIAAVAGAAGAVAGQLASLAFGLTDKFDWGAVALGAVTSVVSAGVGSAMQGFTKAAKEAGDSASMLLKFAGSGWARGAAQAVSGMVANYGTNWALNRVDSSRDRSNEKFSWAHLAASAVSGALAGKASGWTEGLSGVEQIFADTATGFGSSFINHNVASLFGAKGRPDYGQMAVDAFGNALGAALKRGISDIKSKRNEQKVGGRPIDDDRSIDERARYMIASADQGPGGPVDPVLSKKLAERFWSYQAAKGGTQFDALGNEFIMLHGYKYGVVHQLEEVVVKGTNPRRNSHGGLLNALRGYANDAVTTIIGGSLQFMAGTFRKINETSTELFNVSFDTRQIEKSLMNTSRSLIESPGYDSGLKANMRRLVGSGNGVAEFVQNTAFGLVNLSVHAERAAPSYFYRAATRWIGIDKKNIPFSGVMEGELKYQDGMGQSLMKMAKEAAPYAAVPNGLSMYVGMKAWDGISKWGSDYAGNIHTMFTTDDPRLQYESGLKFGEDTAFAASIVIPVVQEVSAMRVASVAARLEVEVAVELSAGDTVIASESSAIETNAVEDALGNFNKTSLSAERLTELVDEFAGRTSMRDFLKWKKSLLEEGLSSAEVSDVVYQGSLKRGSNPWGGDWKKYYEEITGTTAPDGMINPHAHHLVEKGGKSLAAQTNRQILEEVGIDPWLSRENFTWAPNVTGMHGTIPQTRLMNMLKPVRGNPEGINQVLQQWAKKSATHQ
jgi:YD repeat-containing protein